MPADSPSTYHTLLVRSDEPVAHFTRALRAHIVADAGDLKVSLRALDEGDAEDLAYVFGLRPDMRGLVVSTSPRGAQAVLRGVLEVARRHPAARIALVSERGTLLDFDGGRVTLRSVPAHPRDSNAAEHAP